MPFLRGAERAVRQRVDNDRQLKTVSAATAENDATEDCEVCLAGTDYLRWPSRTNS